MAHSSGSKLLRWNQNRRTKSQHGIYYFSFTSTNNANDIHPNPRVFGALRFQGFFVSNHSLVMALIHQL